MSTITNEQINNYTAYLAAEERAEGTIEKYRRDLKALAGFLEDQPLTQERAAG